MDRVGTQDEGGAENPCRALVVVSPGDGRDEPARRASGGRPMAGFLAQLIVDTNPALRVARSERTRTAVALYARVAGVTRGRQRA
ncbi:hypothetical protein HPGCJGGD_4264 [Methylobacterium haplocladii]|uniref:Uncharacterized protein n=1 Tax=Methylobacterium haplocladii TaxID=1176176 RepID=A0A512ILE7_9HYPH|nr:hypothetical protein MHA02_08460 [Methylobacterium haplocladii]GJD86358.1 hypothetical protein HPGCJGGD_4264 [Methylobacterium haplocladii]